MLCQLPAQGDYLILLDIILVALSWLLVGGELGVLLLELADIVLLVFEQRLQRAQPGLLFLAAQLLSLAAQLLSLLLLLGLHLTVNQKLIFLNLSAGT